jgi:hypothetical protein
MSAISIQQMADRVAALMEERLGTRGTGLDTKLRRAGRNLPRRVRAAGAELAQAAAMAQNPKLLLQIDHDATARAYDICVKHLSAISARGRRMDGLMAVVTSIGLSVLVVALILIAVLRWRGFI